jgi:hypothetical protein
LPKGAINIYLLNHKVVRRDPIQPLVSIGDFVTKFWIRP